MAGSTDLGPRIRQARRQMDLTQGALAERLGVHLSRVAEWERGQHVPGTATLAKLAAVFAMTTDQLLNGDPSKTSGATPEAADTRQMALDALELSGRLNAFAQSLLAQGGAPGTHHATPAGALSMRKAREKGK